MDACMETSRIKQAISSVQLFIQRCLLGLEEKQRAFLGQGEPGGVWLMLPPHRSIEAHGIAVNPASQARRPLA
jgi:hypothetical protein